ncbi:AgmX/PglI C-terminal domain-containing protein [Myxococcota bacterium]|nr:AgmX/PglI C-terminal domain-containing protein [Myxococcota bacterium]MBU1431657.1 AgmX/PglI C-terminal domain-containing protein [Myxococcota bacterium]MBU1900018.1 AgmX/PglI C-terminal domain-containing protein [Myxococcota bacterium]
MRAYPLILTLIALGCGPQVNEVEQGSHQPPPDSRLRDLGEDKVDDGMSVSGLEGVLDEDVISTVITEHFDGFSYCFKKARAPYISGNVTLRFQVAQSGRVRQVHVERADLGSRVIEDCLLQTAKHLTFPKPRGDGDAYFLFPFDWNRRGRSLSQDEGQDWGYESMRASQGLIDACRDKHSFQAPFHLTIYVGRSGRLLSAGFHSKDYASEVFASCIVTALNEVQFPNPGDRVIKYHALLEKLTYKN